MNGFWTEQQEKDMTFFNENIEKWVSDPFFRQKFVVISGGKVTGLYDSFDTALSNAVVSFGAGEYIIQQILPDNETVNFLSPALALS